MTLHQLGNAIIYLGAVAGALAALGILARFAIVRPMQRWLREQVSKPLQTVHDEVTHNHGSSLKDSAVRTEKAVKALRRQLRDHVENHPGPS